MIRHTSSEGGKKSRTSDSENIADALSLQPPKTGTTGVSPPSPKARRSTLIEATETDQDQNLDQKLEQTIRPKTLDEYVGQQELKSNLAITLEAAQNRNEALDHMLLYGPPGLGKTTLANIIAQTMGAAIHITSAPALERPRDILGILMGLRPGSVLFIDEIHRLNKVTEEILYPAMEDFRLDRTIGKGESTKIISVPMPRFTLIGATTKAGAISSPLRDRFGIVQRLNFYTHTELVDIITRSSGILNIAITPDGAMALASRSRGTPRIANRLLRRVRDFAQVKKQTEISEAIAKEALDLFNIDPLGLDATDRQLLQTLADNFKGGPVGLEALASTIGEDTRTLEEVVEPYLLQMGLIHRTPRGRMLSPKACQHLGIAISSLNLQQTLFD